MRRRRAQEGHTSTSQSLTTDSSKEEVRSGNGQSLPPGCTGSRLPCRLQSRVLLDFKEEMT
ncbi:hypothetical protein I79_022443 [Cricetulus griseus]|uniref:Uncharacterized protein n=1 Tax=Cricetulus griseus TaxID=10029 RepID=G3IFC2_CRIGR|nr:hypothetical protein I79_022443 [Cricetulus griseus]